MLDKFDVVLIQARQKVQVQLLAVLHFRLLLFQDLSKEHHCLQTFFKFILVLLNLLLAASIHFLEPQLYQEHWIFAGDSVEHFVAEYTHTEHKSADNVLNEGSLESL